MFTSHVIIFGFGKIGSELLKEIKRVHPEWYVVRIINQGTVFDGEENMLGTFNEKTLEGLRDFIPTTIHFAFFESKKDSDNLPQQKTFFTHRFIKLIEYEENSLESVKDLVLRAEELLV